MGRKVQAACSILALHHRCFFRKDRDKKGWQRLWAMNAEVLMPKKVLKLAFLTLMICHCPAHQKSLTCAFAKLFKKFKLFSMKNKLPAGDFLDYIIRRMETKTTILS